MAAYTITAEEINKARAKSEERIARYEQMANICDALTVLDGKYYTKGLHEAIKKAAPTSLQFYADTSASGKNFFLEYHPPMGYSDVSSVKIATEDNKRRISAEDLRAQAEDYRKRAAARRLALENLEIFVSQYNAAVVYAGELLGLFSSALTDVKDLYHASL